MAGVSRRMVYKKSQKVARDGKHGGGNSSCGSPGLKTEKKLQELINILMNRELEIGKVITII